MFKKGDTLIEVTLAIGIFSMVAISVVAVMTSGTSNAQNALETTLAREEIDTQAEALRFIHSAYLADEESGEGKDPYTKLWEEITKHVYIPGANEEQNIAIQQFNPTTCDQIFGEDGSLVNTLKPYAFVINPRKLSSNDLSDAYVRVENNTSKFRAAATYPRLIYNAKQENNEDTLIDNTSSSTLISEGIYVIGVADPKSTNDAKENKKVSAYYDFYIRTCWYGTGSESPSSISTVIRLYNPKGIAK